MEYIEDTEYTEYMEYMKYIAYTESMEFTKYMKHTEYIEDMNIEYMKIEYTEYTGWACLWLDQMQPHYMC